MASTLRDTGTDLSEASNLSMDNLERLAYWKTVAVDAVRAAGRDGADELEAATWADEDDLFAFFDCFRPDGKGVERVFAGVAGGAEIAERLLKVYEYTKDSLNPWGYFIVRRPAPATPARLIDLTTRHFGKVKQIAQSYLPEGDELVGWLETIPRIEIKYEPAPDRRQPDYDAPETGIHDLLGDWFRSLEPKPSDALMLGEAFYSIACDYNIAHYLMWPLSQQSTDIEDPFAPYFDLWTHGAQAIFERPGRVAVYVPGAS